MWTKRRARTWGLGTKVDKSNAAVKKKHAGRLGPVMDTIDALIVDQTATKRAIEELTAKQTAQTELLQAAMARLRALNDVDVAATPR